jgi:hypothetical protein
MKRARDTHAAETSATFPGLPGFAITGYGAINAQAFRPGFRKSRQYNFLDNLTWVRGNHSLKVGTDIRWFSESDENCAYCRSSFSFTGTYTGNGFADYMLGIPFQGNRSFPRNQVGIRRERSDHFYFQDDCPSPPVMGPPCSTPNSARLSWGATAQASSTSPRSN